MKTKEKKPARKPIIEVGDTVKFKRIAKGIKGWSKNPQKVEAVINSALLPIPVVLLKGKTTTYTPAWFSIIKKHSRGKTSNKRMAKVNVFERLTPKR